MGVVSSHMSHSPHYVKTPHLNLYNVPDETAHLQTQLLYGERVIVGEVKDGFVKVKALWDGYVGWVRQEGLCALGHLGAPTHSLSVRQGVIYEKPDLKSSPKMLIPFLSSLWVCQDKQTDKQADKPADKQADKPADKQADRQNENGFCALKTGGFIFTKHLSPYGEVIEKDYVETAIGFLGTAYLWGGRTYQGIDCSALVQLALFAANISCPRDSTDQLRELGKEVEPPYQRGDIVFWKAHVGFFVG